VSAGYVDPEPRKLFFKHMDAANIDLKAFTDKFYFELCGAHLNNVLDTLVYIKHETNTWLEITTLLIPDENDSSQEIDAMTQWIVKELGVDVPLHFTAFHPDWKMRDKKATPVETLTRARDIAMKNGLNYVYTGNVHDKSGSSTYCPNCKNIIIGRDWYQLSDWQIKLVDENKSHGQCAHCGTSIAGFFSAQPGQWGAQRSAVRFV
jgi:pyruvate formate lyase activating enzyme